MTDTYQQRKSNDYKALLSEQGTFFTELALVLPLLFILMISTIDLSIGMLTYLRASRVAYEAARYGSSISNMSGNFDSTKSICEQAPPSSYVGNRELSMVVTRAQSIMNESILFFTNSTSVDYRISYEPANRQIHVCLIVPWTSIMPGLLEKLGGATFGGSIKATASAPYLFSS